MFINYHPEWEIIEEWFNRRARESGKGYAHHEVVTIPSALDDSVSQVAKKMAEALGKQIADMMNEELAK